MGILQEESIAKYPMAYWALRDCPAILLQYFLRLWKYAFIILSWWNILKSVNLCMFFFYNEALNKFK